MTSGSNGKHRRERDLSMMIGLAVPIGAGAGTAFGVALGNIGAGLATGVGIGVAVGVVLSLVRKSTVTEADTAEREITESGEE